MKVYDDAMTLIEAELADVICADCGHARVIHGVEHDGGITCRMPMCGDGCCRCGCGDFVMPQPHARDSAW